VTFPLTISDDDTFTGRIFTETVGIAEAVGLVGTCLPRAVEQPVRL